MTNNLSDILLWIESPDNFSKGIGSLDSKDQIKKYSELISKVISKPVQEWMALGVAKLEESYHTLSEMRKSVFSLFNHFENQKDYYQKDNYESLIGQPHIYDVDPPKGVSDEWLEIKRQERLKEEKIAVENIRKNKDAILQELHTKSVILNTWERELIDQMNTIKRSKALLKLETNTANIELSAPTQELTTHQKIEMALRYMNGNDLRSHKQILSEAEFENLVAWVRKYFDDNLSVPKIMNPIRRVNTIQGNVVTTFKYLYKEIYPAGKFPDSIFILIKACFYEYREDNIENLKKTSEPKYYQEQIRESK